MEEPSALEKRIYDVIENAGVLVALRELRENSLQKGSLLSYRIMFFGLNQDSVDKFAESFEQFCKEHGIAFEKISQEPKMIRYELPSCIACIGISKFDNDIDPYLLLAVPNSRKIQNKDFKRLNASYTALESFVAQYCSEHAMQEINRFFDLTLPAFERRWRKEQEEARFNSFSCKLQNKIKQAKLAGKDYLLGKEEVAALWAEHHNIEDRIYNGLFSGKHWDCLRYVYYAMKPLHLILKYAPKENTDFKKKVEEQIKFYEQLRSELALELEGGISDKGIEIYDMNQAYFEALMRYRDGEAGEKKEAAELIKRLAPKLGRDAKADLKEFDKRK